MLLNINKFEELCIKSDVGLIFFDKEKEKELNENYLRIIVEEKFTSEELMDCVIINKMEVGLGENKIEENFEYEEVDFLDDEECVEDFFNRVNNSGIMDRFGFFPGFGIELKDFFNVGRVLLDVEHCRFLKTQIMELNTRVKNKEILIYFLTEIKNELEKVLSQLKTENNKIANEISCLFDCISNTENEEAEDVGDFYLFEVKEILKKTVSLPDFKLKLYKLLNLYLKKTLINKLTNVELLKGLNVIEKQIIKEKTLDSLFCKVNSVLVGEENTDVE